MNEGGKILLKKNNVFSPKIAKHGCFYLKCLPRQKQKICCSNFCYHSFAACRGKCAMYIRYVPIYMNVSQKIVFKMNLVLQVLDIFCSHVLCLYKVLGI